MGSLVQAVGGLRVLRRFTGMFYEKAFADPHLDKFIRSHEDPHGERFAAWITKSLEMAHHGQMSCRHVRRHCCVSEIRIMRCHMTGPVPTSQHGILPSARLTNGASTSSWMMQECGCAYISGQRGRLACLSMQNSWIITCASSGISSASTR